MMSVRVWNVINEAMNGIHGLRGIRTNLANRVLEFSARIQSKQGSRRSHQKVNKLYTMSQGLPVFGPYPIEERQ